MPSVKGRLAFLLRPGWIVLVSRRGDQPEQAHAEEPEPALGPAG